MARHVTFCTWADVPHLSEAAKADLLASYPEHEREARTKGIPSMGQGLIYPISEESIVIDAIPLPDHFARVCAFDPGYKHPAAVWLAYDRDGTDTVYVYDEYYPAPANASVHAAAIRAKGDWIPVVCDPASEAASQIDGRRYVDVLREAGLDISMADHAVGAGILAVGDRMNTGKLKVFRNCVHLLQEKRLYRRIKGKIHKERDHALDALRYGIVSGLTIAKCRPSRTGGLKAPGFRGSWAG